VEFVADKSTLGQISPRSLRLSPVNILPLLRIHSGITWGMDNRSLTDAVPWRQSYYTVTITSAIGQPSQRAGS
jgi:hypothetical protein